MGSLLSRVSMSLQRGNSQEDESLKWPTSDSIPKSYFSFPGPASFKVRGANYLSDKQKVCHCCFSSLCFSRIMGPCTIRRQMCA